MLTACGGGGGGGGGGSSSSSSSSSSADTNPISSTVLANITASPTKLSELSESDKVGSFAFQGTDGTVQTLSVVYPGGNTTTTADIDGETVDLTNVSNHTANEYAALLSFEADGQQYNNVIVGSPTETATVQNAVGKNLVKSMNNGTARVTALVTQTTGDTSQSSELDLAGTSRMTIDFSTGKVTTALSGFSGTCVGTCGGNELTSSNVNNSPFNISITDATIGNNSSGFSGGTLTITDTGDADGLGVNFETLGFDEAALSHGGQFFGDGSSVTVDGEDVVLPKEAGGNFHIATDTSDWLQGGYISSE